MRNICRKYIGLLGIVFTSLFVIFVINTNNTSAYTFGSTGFGEYVVEEANFTAGGLNFDRQCNTLTGQMWLCDVSDSVNDPTRMTGISLSPAWSGSSRISVPAHSIFAFRTRVTASSNVNLVEVGGTPDLGWWSLLDFKCINNGVYESDWTCTYWGYTNQELLNFNLSGTIALFNGTGAGIRYFLIDRYVNYVRVITESGGSGSSDGLSASDRQFLSEQIALINAGSHSIGNLLRDIKTLIESQGDSQEETLENIQSAIEQQNEQDQQDRDNLQQQSQDIKDEGDSSQSDAETQGTTLLGAFSAFVGALTNANPSNCNIDMDLGNLDLGVVNFCQLDPPAGFTTLSSIFLILFCVPLSIATARKVISLFRSFQE